MADSGLYRWWALVVVVAVMSVSTWFRRRARTVSGTIPRRQEEPRLVAMRLAFALPLFLSVILYLANPRWMAWASFTLPNAIRLAGGVLGTLTVPGAFWVFVSIGENISETVLTKEHHILVTHGPYRWIRHPLYTVGSSLFVAVGLMAANWLILGAAAVALVAIRVVVIPKEERQLVERFGDAYRSYQGTTGRMFPRLFRG